MCTCLHTQARVVHLPGMEDEPSTTFTNLSSLFSKLGISDEGEERDGGGGSEEVADSKLTWKEEDSERLAKALKTPPTSPPATGTWRETSSDSPSSARVSSVCNIHVHVLTIPFSVTKVNCTFI